jgi:hypothetical protein
VWPTRRGYRLRICCLCPKGKVPPRKYLPQMGVSACDNLMAVTREALWLLRGAYHATLRGRPLCGSGAHNDNASSISARNDGRLDAIASPFGLVLALKASPEGRDQEASLRTGSTREHPADQLQPQTPAKNIPNGSGDLLAPHRKVLLSAGTPWSLPQIHPGTKQRSNIGFGSDHRVVRTSCTVLTVIAKPSSSCGLSHAIGSSPEKWSAVFLRFGRGTAPVGRRALQCALGC